MTSTLIRNARILAVNPEGASTQPADILIDGSVIAAVAPGLHARDAEARVIDAAGHLAMPGMINGHFHSPVNHMKGCLDGLPLELFMLYESPSIEGLLPSPREAYVRTMLAAVEMLRHGVTAVQDDAFLVPHPTPPIIDAVMQAYADAGIRARVALDQQDRPDIEKLPFLADILPEALSRRLAEPAPMGSNGLLAAYAHLFETWHGACDGRLQASVSCSAPQRVTDPYFAALDDLSRRHDAPFYCHMLETKTQRVLGQEKYGHSLVRHVAELGYLTERMNVIHAIWVDAADLDLIADAGAVVAHNPVCNLRLGSGVMPFRAMRDRGIPICLGTDEQAADDSVDLWGAVKMAGLVHNLGDPDYLRWPRAAEVLDCLFRGGARAMRAADRLGAIEPGRQADLVLLDLDTLAFTPLNDVARQLVYVENGSSVRLTMVAGRVVFEGGRVTTVDETALRAEARAIFEARREALREASVAADAWLPGYRAMYLRAMRLDVGMERRLGGALG